MLDANKNGTIEFSEFLAPLMPELSADDVQKLTKQSKITLKDLTMLRTIFQQLLTSNSNNDSQSVQVVKLTNFLLEVKIHKSETLTRAYKQLIEHVHSKNKNRDRLSVKEFSRCLANLENELLQKYCLLNYFDRGTKTINNFTVNFNKSLDILEPEDLKAHFNQYEQLKQNRSEQELSIFNP